MKELSMAVEQIADCVAITDREGVIRYVNAAFEKETGYTREEALGKTPRILKSGEHDARFYEALWKTILAGKVFKAVFINRKKTGELVYEHKTITPLKDSQGNITHFVSTAKNITEQVQAEKALRESEKQYRDLFESTSDLIQAVAPDGHLLFANRAWREALGYTEQELINLNIDRVVHPEALTQCFETLQRAMSGGQVDRIETRFVTKEGKSIIVEGSVACRFEASQPMAITCFLRDITERKQAEDALRQSEEKYRTLVEQASDGIFVADAEGNYIEVNSRGCEMLGYTRAEILQLKISDLLESGEMERSPLRLDELRLGKSLLTERPLVRKDGSVISTEISAKMLPNGQLQAFVRDITERKQVEEQLHDSEERFRTTFEQAAVGIAHVGTDGGWLRVNQRLCDIVGYTRDELPGLTFQDITHPDDLQTDLNYVHQMLADEIKAYSMEKRYIRKDRSIVWINLTVSLVRKTSGEPKYFISVVEDITERKRAEAERVQLLNVLESSLNEIYIFDAETLCFQYVNQGALRNLGYTREAMNAMTPLDLKSEFDQSSFSHLLEPLLRREQEQVVFHTVHRRTDGSHYPVEVHLQMSDFYGKRVFHAVILDITERKQAEEEIVKLYNAVEQSADITMITDQDGIIEYVNPAFEVVTGYSKAEVIGKSPRILNSEMMETEYYQKIWTTILLGEVFRGEVIDRKKGGEIFYYDQTISPIKNARGNITHFVSTGKDVTERKQVEQEILKLNAELEQRVAERTSDLNRANIELERSMRVKDEFLANMSHELRTPLTGILGLSESLEEQIVGQLNEKQQNYVHTIRESGHHLLTLINDILDLAKIEAGQIALDFSEVDIRSLCEASLRMVKELAQKKHQDIGLEMDDGLGLIWADNRRLKQMIINLLSNAVKFTPEGGRIGLEAHGYRDENKMTIAVWDSGVGINESDLALLFQPFIQLDSSLARESAGTGLGLALVAQMARLHGGSVNAASEPGKGSRFTISLPWEPALETETTFRGKDTGKLRAIKPGENRPTILLVEDTNEVIMVVRDYLEYAGYKAETARNGMDGIAQAKKVRPDLILMDVQMPGMDGLEAAQRLRSEPEFEHTPIIALTALVMQGDRERCLAAGMDEYISKPVNLQAMLKMIQNFLSVNEGNNL